MPLSLWIAIAISAGVASGVFLDPAFAGFARWTIAMCGTAAFLLAARGWRYAARWPCYIALAAASVLLGADAEERALHPSIRTLLEERVGGFLIDTIDTERHDTPIVIEGRLENDATATENGASVRLAIRQAWFGPCPEPAAGGVALS